MQEQNTGGVLSEKRCRFQVGREEALRSARGSRAVWYSVVRVDEGVLSAMEDLAPEQITVFLY